MPRYQYRCEACTEVSTINHASTDQATECPKCNASDSLVKLLSVFRTTRKTTVSKKVGAVTEEFISKSREELQQQKADLGKKR